MQVEAAAALVADRNRDRLGYAAQVVIGRLRQAERIDYTPTRPAPQIAPEPDQRATAGGALAAPLGEGAGHDLTGDDPAESNITLVVGVTQLERIHAKEACQIVIAYIVEIPAGAEVARCARFPGRMVGAGGQPAGH